MKILAKLLLRISLFVFILSGSIPAFSQQKSSDNNLFSAGYAGAFIDGLYNAYYPYRQLEKHGDFGLGAPDMLDGEFIMLNGKYYQTRHTGITTALADTGKTPYAVVCFFKAEKIVKPGKPLNKAALFSYLDSVLNSQNGMFAIHITGTFKHVKTRAFPPVKQKPYLPMAEMLDKQAFFNSDAVQGDLVGYKLPAFMQGPFIAGYHFHFLSTDKTKGGHMVDIITDNVTIEVETLTSFTLDVPQTADFKNYSFKKDNSADIKSVENGKK
jgi:acetolactate decarboxylase